MRQVSVVVPVWNAGPYLDRCVRSLLGQTMPTDQVELLFVDDGSTDGSGQRLDALAREHAQVRVLHEVNSGWAGRPRNVGITAASGRWIQFVDQDDVLAPDALMRLVELGERANADIVLGKVASNFRPVDHDVFAQNQTAATVATWPLINSLTPHKMFRRKFLLDHGLRFPEGKRRLEDQVFMTQAYLASRHCAVLADYTCYFYLQRADRGNAGSQRLVPAAYYRDLEEVLDAVVSGTTAGEVRDRLLQRFLRNEVLRKVSGPRILDRSPRYRAKLWSVTRDLTRRRFSAAVIESLTTVDRATAALLLDSRDDDLLELTRRRNAVRIRAHASDIERDESGWRLTLNTYLEHDDGEPVLLQRNGPQWYLEPRVFPPGFDNTQYEVSADLDDAAAAVMLVHRESHVSWFLPATWQRVPEPVGANGYRLAFRGTVRLRPFDEAHLPPLDDGPWDLRVRVRAFGFREGQPVSATPRMGYGRVERKAGQRARLHVGLRSRQLLLDVNDSPTSRARTALSRRLGRAS